MEYNMTYAEVIGVLEMCKLDMFRDACINQENDEEREESFE